MLYVMVKNIYIIGIMEHVEPAGIHSGDSYAVLPPYSLGDFVMNQIIIYTKKIALELRNCWINKCTICYKRMIKYI